MAGHSKWANIQHRKGAQDAKRGKLFTKLIREITVSALREWMAELGKRAHVAVSFLGKYKTALQILALILLLYHKPLLGLPTQLIGFALLYLAAGLTVWSMFVYLETAWTVLRAK